MDHHPTKSQICMLQKIGITKGNVIDILRKKYHIEIYNTSEPFVCPSGKYQGKVVYGFSVKICNPKWGWNARQYLGKTDWMPNIWEAQRRAITIALKWILSHKSQKSKKSKTVSKK